MFEKKKRLASKHLKMKDENDVSATQITSRFRHVTSSRDVRNVYTRVVTDVTRDVSDVTYLSLGLNSSVGGIPVLEALLENHSRRRGKLSLIPLIL